ncbi:hypothetical protein ACFPT7_23455 [Acidicapsa dinghuensis]|uniref:Urocanase Rossmann-like domain-containing protein n=1 Tax=Acidicapsa dinghuensis TaxID=2218256 RepID=A0ABW1ELY1_9BACT|nr:hypothetical protein [Acidicapsa dinghuensis]
MSSSHSPALPTRSDPIAETYRLYQALADTLPFDPHGGLGGRLLFAGDIHAENRLLTAASIAGAASLGASSDATVLRQAMRDGAIDFLVTSLEEALRILKNEVRKKQPVAVGVSEAPERVVSQMQRRGVLPDLLPPAAWGAGVTGMDEAAEQCFRAWGSLPVNESGSLQSRNFDVEFTTWTADRRAAIWLTRIDQVGISVVQENDALRQRWLRLAPRYLGRAAMQRRGVAMTPDELESFRAGVNALVAERTAAGEEPVSIRIEVPR